MRIPLQYIQLYLIYYSDNNINQILTSRMERLFIIKYIWTGTTSREVLSRVYNHTNSKVQNYQFIYSNLLPPSIYMTYFNVTEYLLLYHYAYNIILIALLQSRSGNSDSEKYMSLPKIEPQPSNPLTELSIHKFITFASIPCKIR